MNWRQLPLKVEAAAKICNLHRVFVFDENRRRIYIDEEADFGQALENTAFEAPKGVAPRRVQYEESSDSAEVDKFTDVFSKRDHLKNMAIQHIEASLASGFFKDVCRHLAGKEVCGALNQTFSGAEVPVRPAQCRVPRRDPSVLHGSANKLLVAMGGFNYAPTLEGIRLELRLEDMLVVGYEVAKYHNVEKKQSDIIIGYASNNKDNCYTFGNGSFFATDVNAQLKDLMKLLLQQMRDSAPNSALPPRILLVRGIGQRGQDKHVQSELEAFRAGCEELGYRPQISQILVFKQGIVKDFIKRISVGQGVEFRRRKTHLNSAGEEDQNGLFERKTDGTDVDRLNAELELH